MAQYRVKDGSLLDREKIGRINGAAVSLNEQLFPNSTEKLKELTLNNAVNKSIQEGAEDVGNQYLKRALSGRNLNALMNLGFAFSD